MPRKLIAAQVIVVLSLVALVYLTLLRPDDGGPPRVVDAPSESQANLPNLEGQGLREGPDNGSGPGATGTQPAGEQDAAGTGGDSSSPDSPGELPSAPGLPGDPDGPPDSDAPDDGTDLDGDGGYGPGDDQYGSSVTRLQARIGLGADRTIP